MQVLFQTVTSTAARRCSSGPVRRDLSDWLAKHSGNGWAPHRRPANLDHRSSVHATTRAHQHHDRDQSAAAAKAVATRKANAGTQHAGI